MKRRTFIQMAGMAGAVLATGRLSCLKAAPTGSEAGTIKKAVKFGMIEEDLSVLDKFKLLKSLGFDGVEMDSPNDLELGMKLVIP